MKKLQEIIDNIKYEVECEYLDFKKKFYVKNDYKSLIKDIMSFANSSLETDKYIVFGVKDVNGKKSFNNIETIDVSNIENIIHTNIEPTLKFHLEYTIIDKITLMILVVSKENYFKRPFAMKKDYDGLRIGDIYIRKGASNRKADRNDIISLTSSSKGQISVNVIDDFYIDENYINNYKDIFKGIINEMETLLTKFKKINDSKINSESNLVEDTVSSDRESLTNRFIQNMSFINMIGCEKYNILEDKSYKSVVEFSKKHNYFVLNDEILKINIYKKNNFDLINPTYSIEYGDDISKDIFKLLKTLDLKVNEFNTLCFFSEYYKFIKIGVLCKKSVTNLNISIPTVININDNLENQNAFNTFRNIIYKNFTDESYKEIEFEYRPKNVEEVNHDNKLSGLHFIYNSNDISEYDFIDLFSPSQCENFQYTNGVLKYKAQNVNTGEMLCFPFYIPVNKDCKIRISHTDETVSLNLENIIGV